MPLAPLVLVVLVGDVMLWGALRRLSADAAVEDPQRSAGLRLWSLSFAVGAARYGFALGDALSPHPFLRIGMLLAATGSAVAMFEGVRLYLGHPAGRFARAAGLAITVWILLCPALGCSGLALTGPVFGFLGSVMLAAGASVLLYGGPGGKGGPQSRITGVLLLVWGLHRLDYPFLRDVEWFAPWGFAMAAMLELGVGVSFLWAGLAQATEGRKDDAKVHRSFYERSPVGFFRCDTTGKFLEANPALVSLLGYANEREVLSRSIPSLTTSEADAFVFRDPGALRSGRLLSWRTVTGKPVFLAFQGRALHDDHGTIAGYEAFVRDMTAETHLDHALQHAQRLEFVGELAGGIAHDFNNLLTVILGNAYLLENQLTDDAQRAMVEEIANASETAARLTRQMLALSRPSTTHRVPVDLALLVRKTAAVLRRMVGPERTLTLADVPDEPAMVMGGVSQLEQVLINLVANARDATGPGGQIRVGLTPVGADWQLCVKDDGGGVDASVLPTIFDPFFTTKGEGMGLGLAVVHRIVKSMDGEVAVQSTGPEGTTFCVRLPSARHTRHTPEACPDAPGARRLLIVDDEPAVTRYLARGLAALGFDLTLCNDPQNALAILADQAFDAVLSDITMPELNGVDLAHAIRASYPQLPILLMTGFTRASDDDVRPFRVIEKPFAIDALVQALAAAQHDFTAQPRAPLTSGSP